MKYITTLLLFIFLFTGCTKKVVKPTITTADFITISMSYNGIGTPVFVDGQNGLLLVDNNTLLKTTDGGNSWTTCYQCTGQDNIYNVKYPTVDTVYISIENATANCNTFRSTDGGLNWTQLFTLHEYPDLSFYCGKYGYAAGSIPPSTVQTLLRTSNAGVQWGTCAGHLPGSSNGFFQFVSDNIGFCGSAGVIYNTFDGGVTWNSIGGCEFFGKFSKSGIGFKIDGGIYKSTDFGNTWRLVYVNNVGPNYIRSVDFCEDGLCAAAIDGHILISLDFGETWKDCVQRSGPDISSYRFYALTVIDNKNIICSGHEFTNYRDFLLKISL